MAKLTGAKKKAFLERMAKGRKKAARSSPKKKAAKKPAKKKAAKKPAKKKTAANPRGKLRGAKKAAFLKRMAKGRKTAARNPKYPKSSTRTWEIYKTDTGRTAELAQGDAKKDAVLARWRSAGYAVAARLKKNPSVRSSKKLFRKAFGPDVTREWGSAKRKATSKATSKAKKRRRNSSEAEAIDMYTTFHGKAPGRIVEYEEFINFPQHFAELGRLKELQINLDRANPEYPFMKFGDCKVVCTPDGQNIYFVGGDQGINLDMLEIGGDKDMVELGPCVYICYHTTKDFHSFEPTDYYHSFGEVNGVQPVLAYDRLNRKLFLMGGDYHVKREGIVN